MANAARLREAIRVIRENPHRWNQSDYADGEVNVEATSWQECGTTFCLGGWGAVLNGYRPVCTMGFATGLFYDPKNPHVFVDGEHAGQDAFDLTYEEANYLFYYMTDSIDSLEEAVEQVIAGNAPSCDFD